MSETDTETTTGDAQPDVTTQDDREALTERDIRELLLKGALVLLTLLAVLATIRFYLAASSAISVWVEPRFRPLFQAGFNLAVLLAAGIGISIVVRKLTG